MESIMREEVRPEEEGENSVMASAAEQNFVQQGAPASEPGALFVVGRWRPFELEMLRADAARGVLVKETAKKLNRGTDACWNARQRLGIHGRVDQKPTERPARMPDQNHSPSARMVVSPWATLANGVRVRTVSAG